MPRHFSPCLRPAVITRNLCPVALPVITSQSVCPYHFVLIHEVASMAFPQHQSRHLPAPDAIDPSIISSSPSVQMDCGCIQNWPS